MSIVEVLNHGNFEKKKLVCVGMWAVARWSGICTVRNYGT
jgi:hypothetical protein